MATYKLSAEIVLQIQQFMQNMNTVIDRIRGVDSTVQRLSTNVSRNVANINRVNLTAFNTSLSQGTLRISNLNSTLQQTPRVVNNATNAVRSSSQTYQNFGRILQDLPFGFTGIQNNLTQLIPATGALGLAFSGIISAITFLQVGTTYWTRGLQDNKKAMDDAKKSGDDYIKTLKGVEQSQLSGSQNAQQELTTLKTLYNAAINASLSTKQRKMAIDELQHQYPNYFKNMSDESIMAGKASDKYKELANSILATARARAAEELIAKNSTRQLEDQNKIINLRIQQQKSLNEEQRAALAYAKQGNTGSGGGGQGAVIGNISGANDPAVEARFRDAKSRRIALDKQIVDLATDYNLLQKDNLKLEQEITKQIKKGADLSSGTAEKAIRDKFQKSDIGDNIRIPGIKVNLGADFDKRIQALYTGTQASIRGLEQTMDAAQTRMIEKAVQFNEAFSEVITSGLSDSLSGIGEAIGSALADGGNVFDEIGKTLLSSLGTILMQLGKVAISIGIGLEAIKASLKSLNPIVAIGAGVALIALGSFFKGAANNIGGNVKGGSGSGGITAFANGGVVSGPTNALIGEYAGARNNPEVVAPLDKLKSMLNLNQDPIFQVVPIVDTKGLAILVRSGESKLNRI